MVDTVPCTATVRCRVEYDLEAECPILDETDRYTVIIEWTPAGETYEKHSLLAWLDDHDGCEMTHEGLCKHLSGGLDGAAVDDLRVVMKDTKHLSMTVERC